MRHCWWGNGVRARPQEGHVAAPHVEALRQFVDRGGANAPTRVPLLRLAHTAPSSVTRMLRNLKTRIAAVTPVRRLYAKNLTLRPRASRKSVQAYRVAVASARLT